MYLYWEYHIFPIKKWNKHTFISLYKIINILAMYIKAQHGSLQSKQCLKYFNIRISHEYKANYRSDFFQQSQKWICNKHPDMSLFNTEMNCLLTNPALYKFGQNPSFGSRDRVQTSFFHQNFTFKVPVCPWKRGQGHQNTIISSPCPSGVSMQVWSKFTNWFRR